jgi:hypothetical protein
MKHKKLLAAVVGALLALLGAAKAYLDSLPDAVPAPVGDVPAASADAGAE